MLSFQRARWQGAPSRLVMGSSPCAGAAARCALRRESTATARRGRRRRNSRTVAIRQTARHRGTASPTALAAVFQGPKGRTRPSGGKAVAVSARRSAASAPKHWLRGLPPRRIFFYRFRHTIRNQPVETYETIARGYNVYSVRDPLYCVV
jgi:hypothetical protein